MPPLGAGRSQVQIRAQPGRSLPVNIRKLKGIEATWRLRVGDWRVLFAIDYDRHAIDVQAVRPRGHAYN
jgi:mRNA-degrading endonuclease RelE of RelBE toxin-antitoxin system